MTIESTAARLARLDERSLSIERLLKSILEEQNSAADSRRRIYEAQERIGRSLVTLDHRMTSVEKSVDAIRPTTMELERVRDRVQFAGRLGASLWSLGKALISAAAGATAYWYAMTGRTPP